MLRAGVSIKDISPPKGVGLAGYPHCPRPNTGVHDPLYAACLYLSDGTEELAIITLDILFYGKVNVKKLRERIGRTLLVSCTHTHSGPWASTLLASELADGIKCDGAYVAWLDDSLAELVEEAASGTFPAAAGTAIGRCGEEQGVGGNRHSKGGACDPTVNVLAVKDETGAIRACLASYALHPTFLHAESTLVSADYPGFIRRYLSFALPDAVFLFANGASGDQSSRFHRVAQNFEEAARVGTTLGVEIARLVEGAKYENNIKISVKSVELELPLKEYPEEDEAVAAVKKARDEFEAAKSEDYLSMRDAEVRLFGAENILNYARLFKDGFETPELPCEIQVATLGHTRIVALLGEVFVEYGLKIKANHPDKKTFVLTTSNGATSGYIYTPWAAQNNCYEAGTSIFTPEAGELIVKAEKEL